jgi:hypothetical protein
MTYIELRRIHSQGNLEGQIEVGAACLQALAHVVCDRRCRRSVGPVVLLAAAAGCCCCCSDHTCRQWPAWLLGRSYSAPGVPEPDVCCLPADHQQRALGWHPVCAQSREGSE